MLIRGIIRLGCIVGPILILLFLILKIYEDKFVGLPKIQGLQGSDWVSSALSIATNADHPGYGALDGDLAEQYFQISSVSSPNKRYFPINFGNSEEAINPNLIPHPHLNDTWILVAQRQRSNIPNTVWCAELVCNAKFRDGAIQCIDGPLILPIAATSSTKCVGKVSFLQMNIGPHDARVFYGPASPYIIYGTQSQFTCFGQYMMDFRMLTDWGYDATGERNYRAPTELQRPQPYGIVEKNFFIFWDLNGQMYAHYDVAPARSFAQISSDGSIGPDLAPNAAIGDEKCLARYIPKLPPTDESIHQATNSLSITLCSRSDPQCKPDEHNTFIMSIFQHKKFYNFHPLYEPYVMLFQQRAPFELHAISQKPFWILGRGKKGYGKKPKAYTPEAKELLKDWNETEMLYVTAMSWKQQGQKYHGYMDDVILLTFGIEDQRTGGIDVLASDLLQDLGLCLAA